MVEPRRDDVGREGALGKPLPSQTPAVKKSKGEPATELPGAKSTAHKAGATVAGTGIVPESSPGIIRQVNAAQFTTEGASGNVKMQKEFVQRVRDKSLGGTPAASVSKSPGGTGLVAPDAGRLKALKRVINGYPELTREAFYDLSTAGAVQCLNKASPGQWVLRFSQGEESWCQSIKQPGGSVKHNLVKFPEDVAMLTRDLKNCIRPKQEEDSMAGAASRESPPVQQKSKEGDARAALNFEPVLSEGPIFVTLPAEVAEPTPNFEASPFKGVAPDGSEAPLDADVMADSLDALKSSEHSGECTDDEIAAATEYLDTNRDAIGSTAKGAVTIVKVKVEDEVEYDIKVGLTTIKTVGPEWIREWVKSQ